jgi:hypothetical protein
LHKIGITGSILPVGFQAGFPLASVAGGLKRDRQSLRASLNMICPPLPRAPLVDDWMDRHRNQISFALHIVGIPPTIVGVLLIPIYLGLMSRPVFLVALIAFTGGYVLQFTGHWVDGTESGEMRWIKKQWSKFTKPNKTEKK